MPIQPAASALDPAPSGAAQGAALRLTLALLLAAAGAGTSAAGDRAEMKPHREPAAQQEPEAPIPTDKVSSAATGGPEASPRAGANATTVPAQEPESNGRRPGHGAPPEAALRRSPSPPDAAAPSQETPDREAATPAALVRATADGTPVFVDRAAATGLDFVHFNGRSGELHFGEIMGSGGALLDYDGDGDLDVFLVQGDRLGEEGQAAATPPPAQRPPRDRLYRNLLVESGELRFRDVTAASGIDGTGYGMGVAVADADGDGDPDLYVTGLASNRLWLNRGDGTFRDATAPSRSDDPRWSTAATFLDHDGDGDLDLFVANYVAWTAAHPERCTAPGGYRDYCGPLNYAPVADRLLENRGVELTKDGAAEGGEPTPVFVNVSAPTGIRFAFGAALGVVAHDLRGDPRPEIYVANDASANQLWTAGADGSWTDVALEAGCALDRHGRPEGSMGVDLGDYDGDGDLDLFLTHVHRETNTLYRNDGTGHFADATRAVGLAAPSLGLTGFGTGFLDYDNDGWLDLLVVNGAVHRIPEQMEAGEGYPLHQPDQLFRNLGPFGEGGADSVRFADVSATAGDALALPRVSRGAAFGDVDNDGDTDVLVTDSAAPVRLLVNQVGQRRHWLGLRLLTAAGSDDPGARVTLELPSGRRLLRRVRLDGSYLSAHDPRVLFGLGDETAAVAAVVRWSDGTEERFPLTDHPVDRYHTLTRGTAPKPPKASAPPAP